jgi:hypothetical protein
MALSNPAYYLREAAAAAPFIAARSVPVASGPAGFAAI